MFTCACMNIDWESFLVVLQGDIVGFGDERLKFLECGVCGVIPL